MKCTVRLDASMTLELNRRQIEVLDHLASYGTGLVKSIREHVTSGVPEADLIDLFKQIGQQTGPAVRTIKEAEKKLYAGTVVP